jgi:hypothetical protein
LTQPKPGDVYESMSPLLQWCEAKRRFHRIWCGPSS